MAHTNVTTGYTAVSTGRTAVSTGYTALPAVGYTTVPSGAATPDPLLVIDRLASAGVTPNFFGCVAMRVSSTYSSNLIRVRKGTGGGATFANIGYDAVTNLLDVAALATFAAGSNCFLVTIFDQSGSARDFTQATEANQCKIYDSATGTLLLGTLVCPLFVAATPTYYARADSCGISGAVACSEYYFGAYTHPLSANNTAIQVGTLTSAARFEAGLSNTDSTWINSLSNSATRLFSRSNVDLYGETCGYVATIAAGGQIGASTYRQQSYLEAFQLVESGVNSGTTTCTFGTGASGIGARSNATVGAGGKFLSWGVFSSVLSGAALTALDNFSAALCVRGYEGTIAIGGQSNASLLVAPQNAPFIAGMQWRKASQGGQALSYFLKSAGTGMYEEMLEEIRKTPAGEPVFQCWLHGESNCTVALAANYLTDLTQLAADLAADSGRSDIFWIVLGLHATGVYDIVGYSPTAKDTVNAALQSFVTTRGASLASFIDPTGLAGALLVAEAPFPTHYDPTLNTSAMTAIGAVVTANI